jgi:hypothetical protein
VRHFLGTLSRLATTALINRLMALVRAMSWSWAAWSRQQSQRKMRLMSTRRRLSPSCVRLLHGCVSIVAAQMRQAWHPIGLRRSSRAPPRESLRISSTLAAIFKTGAPVVRHGATLALPVGSAQQLLAVRALL